MDKNFKRRKLFIKKDFQGRLILGCILFVAGIVLLSNALFSQGLLSSGILIIVGSVLILVASLLLSQRFTGPLYRFETTLDHMQKGRLDIVIQLREKDQGKELAEKINTFNEQLSRSFRTINYSSRAIDSLIGQIEALGLPEEEKEHLAGLCWTLREHNRKVLNNSAVYTSRQN